MRDGKRTTVHDQNPDIEKKLAARRIFALGQGGFDHSSVLGQEAESSQIVDRAHCRGCIKNFNFSRCPGTTVGRSWEGAAILVRRGKTSPVPAARLNEAGP
ncbi:hypothetical protein Dda_8934 [Drechslerella dactyloides]|uniref:Uncharacterized protein n=1 Tax=Drechslerella dactyloides TaxID=74499 RepID=A0AAD6NH55_DREDA|nr:hypothetical protein Dda_8934 [Drechslerella dactyloides]